MQSVLEDTKRDVENVQRNIDKMLIEDVDHRAIVCLQEDELMLATRRCRAGREMPMDLGKNFRGGESNAGG